MITWKRCHEGNIKVIEKSPTIPFNVYGAGGIRGLKVWHNSIILDLANQVSSSVVEFQGIKPSDGLAMVTQPSYAVVKVPWDDGGAPWNLRQIFWIELVKWLKEQKREVIVCCMGGHGRTGTALTILACLLNPEIPRFYGCPVSWIRHRYCDSAVETYEQMQYIEVICNVITKAIPSWSAYTKTVYGSGGATAQKPLPYHQYDAATNTWTMHYKDDKEPDRQEDYDKDYIDDQAEMDALVAQCNECNSTGIQDCKDCTIWQQWVKNSSI